MLRHNLAGELTVARSEQPNELDMSKNKFFYILFGSRGNLAIQPLGSKQKKLAVAGYGCA